MSSPKPLAIKLDFDRPEVVSLVYQPPLPTDGDNEFEDEEDEDYMTMIEAELKERGEPT